MSKQELVCHCRGKHYPSLPLFPLVASMTRGEASPNSCSPCLALAILGQKLDLILTEVSGSLSISSKGILREKKFIKLNSSTTNRHQCDVLKHKHLTVYKSFKTRKEKKHEKCSCHKQELAITHLKVSILSLIVYA